jgi:hypothetical protein
MDTLPLGSPPFSSRSSGAPIHLTALTARFVANLPEFLLINLMLWLAVLAMIWATGGLLHLGQQGVWVLATFFCLPGLWAMMHTVRMAVRVDEVDLHDEPTDPRHS